MLKDLLLKNRSYRSFNESRIVTRKELEDFIDCARITPSSVNMQPLKFYLACEKETVSQIQPLTKWAGLLKETVLPPEGHHPTAFIIICMDSEVTAAVNNFQKDVGIAAQTIMLAAAEKGLGGCMIGSYNGDELAKVLNLSENIKPMLVLALGEPDDEIVLTELAESGNGKTAYYRKDNVHYVPKRSLKDLIIN
ncbi:MAG: nitroreductase [Clostridia bacterium]|nr:nitroreductase [Clostridia bacterium]